MLETRLRDYLEAQHETAPQPEDSLSEVMRLGRRRRLWKRTGTAILGAAAALLMVLGSASIFNAAPSVAASPMTGAELPVINEAPVILQGELGPAPQIEPAGTDLTFAPIDEPTANDLAAIDETIQIEGYTDPTVVSLGSIDEFQTNVYVIHDVEPETGNGQSSLVAIGPDYPQFVSVSGPTQNTQWGPSSSRNPDGDGFVAMRVPEDASWGYIQIEIDGATTWQRPSDGFIWVPYNAQPGETIVVTGRDPSNGDIHLETTIDPIDLSGPLADLRAEILSLEAKVEELAAQITILESTRTTADAQTRAEIEEQIQELSQAQEQHLNRIRELHERISELAKKQDS